MRLEKKKTLFDSGDRSGYYSNKNSVSVCEACPGKILCAVMHFTCSFCWEWGEKKCGGDKEKESHLRRLHQQEGGGLHLRCFWEHRFINILKMALWVCMQSQCTEVNAASTFNREKKTLNYWNVLIFFGTNVRKLCAKHQIQNTSDDIYSYRLLIK